jgi:hypothetical protein
MFILVNNEIDLELGLFYPFQHRTSNFFTQAYAKHMVTHTVTSRHLVAKQEKLGDKCLCLPTSTSLILYVSLTCHKILQNVGLPALPSLWRKVCYGFLLPLAGSEPISLGSNGKHNNHYTGLALYAMIVITGLQAIVFCHCSSKWWKKWSISAVLFCSFDKLDTSQKCITASFIFKSKNFCFIP